ncbi:hypothetical protein [Alloactinosynnema sp. L-07]|uniref:hypothetical protein n=1 Tax=Alloactinosynnema sp. L-07 TaxID=1653480 RepID=UPI0006B44327|nr:hypothetical protein [Alloactinosynnema sp. L-07]
MSKREAPALEPPTDIPAVADPHTAAALRALRNPLLGLPALAMAFGVPAISLALAGVGWVLIALLGIAAVAFLLAAVLTFVMIGGWVGPAAKLLRAESWREAKVKVYRPGRGLPKVKLAVRDGAKTINLVANALPWPAQQVLARTGRIWLVGPDERGWAAIRSAGLALPLGQAKVTSENVSGGYEVNVVQDDPVRVPLASSDAVLVHTTATPRKRSRTDVVLPGLLMVFALVMVFDLFGRDLRADQTPLAIGVVAGTLAIAGLLAWRIAKLRYWAAMDKLLAAGPWTSVPVTLDGDTLRAGDKAVALRRGAKELRANAEATGLLWVAGQPSGKVAVGLPGYPFLSVAEFSD